MSFFRNASIGNQIATALVAPVFGFLLFGVLNLWDKHVNVSNSECTDAKPRQARANKPRNSLIRSTKAQRHSWVGLAVPERRWSLQKA